MKLLIKQEHAIHFLKDNVTEEVLYGGAAGGGKSALGCLWLMEMCQKYPGTRWLMGRSKLKTLKETTLNTFFELATLLKLGGQFNYKSAEHIACLFVLLIYHYKKAVTLKKHETETIAAISDTINYYTNKLGAQTASVKTLKLDNFQLKNILLKKDKELAALASEFSKINHITKYNSVTILDTIKVKFQDSIPLVFKRTGVLTTDWYHFNYTSTQTGIEIDSLTLPTQTTLITGIKQKWFLGAKSLTTTITNTNPYVKITKIESAEITLTQPWYKKWYIWMAAGAVCGWFAAK